MRDKISFFVQRVPAWDGVHVWIQTISIDADGRGTRSVGTNVEMRKVEEMEDVSTTPTLTLQTAAAQGLMDELYRSGFRPSDQPNTASALAATNHHLADMRAIVAKTTGVTLP